jgi:hypothetical protein
MPDIRIELALPVVVIPVAALVAALLAAWLYRSTVPAVSPLRRRLLAVLRGTSLFLILLVCLEPVLHLISSSKELPRIAVLLDNSRSMRIADRGGMRSATLDSLLRSDALKGLSRRAQLHYYTFGVTLRPFDPATQDSLPFNEEGTDLSTALRSLQRERAVYGFDGALIASDGTYTLGQNPVYEAEENDIPLFTVAVGDSIERRDILISRVLANSTAFSGTPTPVDIRIRSSGFGGGDAQVRLLHGSQELARTSLRLESGTREYSVTLTYTPADEGTKRYTAEITPLSGELTALNNRKSFSVRVLRSNLQILVFAGNPSPDLALLRQTLSQEQNFRVRTFTQKGPGEFYEGPVTTSTIDSADCLVMIGFPVAGTGGTLLDRLAQATSEKTPLLFIGGKAVDYGHLRGLASSLPFTVELPSMVELLVSFQPVPLQKHHPLLSLDGRENSDVWSRLPPIFKTLTSVRVRPEAVVLATARTDGRQDPLLLLRTVGRQRSLALLGYGLWRWKLLAQEDSRTAGAYTQFFSTAIRWLTSPPAARRLRVEPAKDLFVQGESVEFLGQAYDATMKPRDDARITVALRSGERTLGVELRPAGNGRYQGSLDGVAEGEYRFTATGEADGEALGQDEGSLTVGEPSLEFQDTRSSPALMRQLASRTGGGSLTPAEFSTIEDFLASHAALEPRLLQRAQRIEIWNWGTVLVLLLMLFATEWIVRRRSGML